MATTSTALLQSGVAASDISQNVGNVLKAQDNLNKIQTKLEDDFRGNVIKLATDTIAPADPTTFNVDGLVTTWTQQSDQFRNRTTALNGIRTQLTNVIDLYKVEHADELVTALKARRAQLQDQLKKQNEADATITKQINEIDTIIFGLQQKVAPAPLSPIEELRKEMEQLIDATRQETSAELSQIWESTYRRLETELEQRIARDEYHEDEIARLKTEIANLRLQAQQAKAAQGPTVTTQKPQLQPTASTVASKKAVKKASRKQAGRKR